MYYTNLTINWGGARRRRLSHLRQRHAYVDDAAAGSIIRRCVTANGGDRLIGAAVGRRVQRCGGGRRQHDGERLGLIGKVGDRSTTAGRDQRHCGGRRRQERLQLAEPASRAQCRREWRNDGRGLARVARLRLRRPRTTRARRRAPRAWREFPYCLYPAAVDPRHDGHRNRDHRGEPPGQRRVRFIGRRVSRRPTRRRRVRRLRWLRRWRWTVVCAPGRSPDLR